MGNIIRFQKDSPAEEWLSVSNMGTDCLLEVILLSASTLKQTKSQKALVEWLKEKKTLNELAPGTVSFDIVDMPWSAEHLAEDQEFMIRVIEGAEDCRNWDQLEYSPDGEIILPWLRRMKRFISECSETCYGREM